MVFIVKKRGNRPSLFSFGVVIQKDKNNSLKLIKITFINNYTLK